MRLNREYDQWKPVDKKKAKQYFVNVYRLNKRGKRSQLPNGLIKIWNSNDSYSVYKPYMLDMYGNPHSKWLPIHY